MLGLVVVATQARHHDAMFRTANPVLLVLAGLALTQPTFSQGLRGTALHKELQDTAEDFWIYDDLDEGYERAVETGKPLLVSFRCVP